MIQENKNQLKRKKTSSIWQHWQQKDQKVLCFYCDSEQNFVGTTSNLWKHTKRYHADKLSDFESNQYSSEIDTDQNSTYILKDKEMENQQAQLKQKSQQQTNLNQYFEHSDSEKNKSLKNKIYMHLILDCCPIYTLEKLGFSNLIKSINPKFQIPSRKTFRDESIRLYQTLQKQIILEFNEANIQKSRQFALQFDHWSSITLQKFITISIQFINAQFQLKTYNLANIPSQGETSVEISKDLKKIMQFYEIINQVNENNQMVDEKPSISFYFTSDGFSANKLAIKEADGTQIVCFIHTCNNVLKEMLEYSISSIIINKVREVNKVFRKSYKIKQQLEQIYNLTNQKKDKGFCSPKIDNDTRFNSVYFMLNSYLNNIDAIKIYVEENKENDILSNLLSPEEQMLLEYMLEITKQFQEIFLVFQQREITTLPLIIPYNYSIREKILNFQAHEPKKIQDLKSYLLNQYQIRFDKFYKPITLLLATSTFLHPLYKNLLQKKDFQLHQQVIQKLQSEMFTFQESQQQFQEEQMITKIKKMKIQEKIEEEEQNNKDLTFNLLRDYQLIQEDNGEQNQVLTHQLILNEIIQYQKQIFNKTEYVSKKRPIELQFYYKNQSQYPILSQIQKYYLCISASTSEQERTFSLMGNIVTNKRNQLKSDIVEALSFLKMNLQLNSISERDICRILNRDYKKIS